VTAKRGRCAPPSERDEARRARGQVRVPSLWVPAWAGAVLDEAAQRLGGKTAALVAALRELAAAEGIETDEKKK
jgi:hypothetical protein